MGPDLYYVKLRTFGHFKLLLIALALPALLAFAACGGDDDSDDPTPEPSRTAASGTVTPDATATEGPTDAPTDTEAPTSQETPEPTPTPTRRPVDYDHYGENITDILGYYNTQFGSGVVVPVPCPYDVADGVIDCTAEGYGRIALDIEPFGGEVTECRAILSPGGVDLVAASCSTSTPATFFYKIVE
jgi:hypothetical protein